MEAYNHMTLGQKKDNVYSPICYNGKYTTIFFNHHPVIRCYSMVTKKFLAPCSYDSWTNESLSCRANLSLNHMLIWLKTRFLRIFVGQSASVESPEVLRKPTKKMFNSTKSRVNTEKMEVSLLFKTTLLTSRLNTYIYIYMYISVYVLVLRR